MNKKYDKHLYVQSTVEDYGLFILNNKDKETYRIEYPDAAIWDLLCKQHSVSEITNLMSSILNDENKMKIKDNVVMQILDWNKKGLIKEFKNV